MKSTTILLTIAAVAALAFTGGCAFMNRDNMRMLNWLEDDVMPAKGTTARQLTYPITVPLGLCAMAADIIVVHPICSVDDAVLDTDDACWSKFYWDQGYVTECAQLPFRVVFSPVVLVFDWAGRCLFDIPPNPRAGTPKGRKVAESPPEARRAAPKPERLHIFRHFFDNDAKAAKAEAMVVLVLGGKPRPVGGLQADLGPNLARALAGDSWASALRQMTFLLPGAGRPLCWIVLQDGRKSIVICLGEMGFDAGWGTPFTNPTLAKILDELVKDEDIGSADDLKRWKAAITAAAGPGPDPQR